MKHVAKRKAQVVDSSLTSYCGGFVFISKPRDPLSSLRAIFFPQLLLWIFGRYFNVHQHRFLSHSFQFTVHWYSTLYGIYWYSTLYGIHWYSTLYGIHWYSTLYGIHWYSTPYGIHWYSTLYGIHWYSTLYGIHWYSTLYGIHW